MASRARTGSCAPIYAGNAIVTVEADASRKLVGDGAGRFVPKPRQVAVGPQLNPSHWTFACSTHTRLPGASPAAPIGRTCRRHCRVISGAQHKYGNAPRTSSCCTASRINWELRSEPPRCRGRRAYAPNEMQVGQTARSFRRKIYIGRRHFRVVQHLNGHQGRRTMPVAINQGQRAPIFDVADVGLVGDLFQIVRIRATVRGPRRIELTQ